MVLIGQAGAAAGPAAAADSAENAVPAFQFAGARQLALTASGPAVGCSVRTSSV